MRDVYSISIERAGVADIPELCQATEPQAAAEIVRALMACHDPQIMLIRIAIVRIKAGQ